MAAPHRLEALLAHSAAVEAVHGNRRLQAQAMELWRQVVVAPVVMFHTRATPRAWARLDKARAEGRAIRRVQLPLQLAVAAVLEVLATRRAAIRSLEQVALA